MRPKLFQPFRLPVRLSIWLVWALLVLGVFMVGSQSPEPNHPVGLLLLGIGLAGSGLLALLTLTIPTLWQRLIDPEMEAKAARAHLYWVVGFGGVGLGLLGWGLSRLL